jgi:hypothetical protein
LHRITSRRAVCSLLSMEVIKMYCYFNFFSLSFALWSTQHGKGISARKFSCW